MKTEQSIFVAHADDEVRSTIIAALQVLNHELVGQSTTVAEMLSQCEKLRPDLVISGVSFPDGDGIEGLIKLSQKDIIPAVVVAETTDMERVERAMDDHVMAYLMAPVDSADLKPTIHVVMRRFAQMRELQSENNDLRDALATRKKLERAKGLLMAKEEITEEDAYLKIRGMATSARVRIADIADQIVKEAEKNAKESA